VDPGKLTLDGLEITGADVVSPADATLGRLDKGNVQVHTAGGPGLPTLSTPLLHIKSDRIAETLGPGGCQSCDGLKMLGGTFHLAPAGAVLELALALPAPFSGSTIPALWNADGTPVPLVHGTAGRAAPRVGDFSEKLPPIDLGIAQLTEVSLTHRSTAPPGADQFYPYTFGGKLTMLGSTIAAPDTYPDKIDAKAQTGLDIGSQFNDYTGFGIGADGKFGYAAAVAKLDPPVTIADLVNLHGLFFSAKAGPPLVLTGGVDVTALDSFAGLSLFEGVGCVNVMYAEASDAGKTPALCGVPAGQYVVPPGGDTLLRASGDLKFLGFPMLSGAAADLHLQSPRWFDVGGTIPFDLGGIGAVTGSASFYVAIQDIKHWQAQAGARACLFGELCASGNFLVNPVGVAVCISTAFADFGGWYRFGQGVSLDNVIFHGCDIGEASQHIAQARAVPGYRAQLAGGPGVLGSQTARADLEGGHPFAVVAIPAVSGRALVTITGPGGFKMSNDGSRRQVLGPHRGFVSFGDEGGNLTYAFIPKPLKGTYIVTSQPGGPNIGALTFGYGLAAPKVTGQVTGSGDHRTLSYTIAGVKGANVRFGEVSDTISRSLGKASGAHGTLSIKPAGARGGTRRVVAYVTQDGLPRQNIAVDSYDAPAVRPLPAPSGLHVTGKLGLGLAWKPIPAARGYEVTARSDDGTRLQFRVAKGSSSAALPGVSPLGDVVATVAAIGADDQPGAAAKVHRAAEKLSALLVL